MLFPAYVKSIVKYKSPHAQDLSFAKGETICVTGYADRGTEDEEEDEDDRWYMGHALDQSRQGQFPASLVVPTDPPAVKEAQEVSPAEPETPDKMTSEPTTTDGGSAAAGAAPAAMVGGLAAGTATAAPSVTKQDHFVEEGESREKTMEAASVQDRPTPPMPTSTSTAPNREPTPEENIQTDAPITPSNGLEKVSASSTEAPQTHPAMAETEEKTAILPASTEDSSVAPAPAPTSASTSPPAPVPVPTIASTSTPSTTSESEIDPSRLSLRDRIAAFNKPVEKKPPPPIPRGKPGGWKRPPPAEGSEKPLLPSDPPPAIAATRSSVPPAKPVATSDHVDSSAETATSSFSASDAKSSIKMSLKERMAALQRKEAEPKVSEPPVVERSVPASDVKAAITEPAQEGSELVSPDEAERRASIARRMAALGGRRMDAGLFAPPPPVVASKPEPATEEASEESTLPNVTEAEPAAPAMTAETDSTAPQPLAVPRRTAAPRTRRAKTSESVPSPPAEAQPVLNEPVSDGTAVLEESGEAMPETDKNVPPPATEIAPAGQKDTLTEQAPPMDAPFAAVDEPAIDTEAPREPSIPASSSRPVLLHDLAAPLPQKEGTMTLHNMTSMKEALPTAEPVTTTAMPTTTTPTEMSPSTAPTSVPLLPSVVPDATMIATLPPAMSTQPVEAPADFEEQRHMLENLLQSPEATSAPTALPVEKTPQDLSASESVVPSTDSEQERRDSITQRLQRMGGQRIAGMSPAPVMGMPMPVRKATQESTGETQDSLSPTAMTSPVEAPVHGEALPPRPMRRAPTLPPMNTDIDTATQDEAAPVLSPEAPRPMQAEIMVDTSMLPPNATTSTSPSETSPAQARPMRAPPRVPPPPPPST